MSGLGTGRRQDASRIIRRIIFAASVFGVERSNDFVKGIGQRRAHDPSTSALCLICMLDLGQLATLLAMLLEGNAGALAESRGLCSS